MYTSCQCSLFVSDPVYYGETAKKEERQQAIMMDEIKAVEKNDTWELVNLREGKNVIGLKWMYRTKYYPDGSIQKHKARLVVKGYEQQQGVDFDEIFSPVACFEMGELEQEVYVA